MFYIILSQDDSMKALIHKKSFFLLWKTEKCTCTVDRIVLLQMLLSYFLPCITLYGIGAAAAVVLVLKKQQQCMYKSTRFGRAVCQSVWLPVLMLFPAACQTPVCSSPPALNSSVSVLIWRGGEVGGAS